MTPTFITSGDVRREYNDDGTTKCFHVSRLGMETTIRLSSFLPEYTSAGNWIKIDKYGKPWVRK